MTSPTAVLEIDFLRDGANLMASLPSAAPEYSTTPSRVVPVELSGSADAVAVWFDLWLDEERTERDVVSTRHERSSRGDSSGWVSCFVALALFPSARSTTWSRRRVLRWGKAIFSQRSSDSWAPPLMNDPSSKEHYCFLPVSNTSAVSSFHLTLLEAPTPPP